MIVLPPFFPSPLPDFSMCRGWNQGRTKELTVDPKRWDHVLTLGGETMNWMLDPFYSQEWWIYLYWLIYLLDEHFISDGIYFILVCGCPRWWTVGWLLDVTWPFGCHSNQSWCLVLSHLLVIQSLSLSLPSCTHTASNHVTLTCAYVMFI